MKKAKLAAGSLLTVEDQIRLYGEAAGSDAKHRQTQLADVKAGRCTCVPSSLKRRWDGAEKATSRRVHHHSCPRWKPWMIEAQS